MPELAVTDLLTEHAKPLSLRRLLLGDPLSPMRIVLLAAAGLIGLNVIEAYVFEEGVQSWTRFGVNYLYYALDGCIALACIRWLDPWLEQRGLRSVRLRALCGALAVGICTIASFSIVYFLAFPLLMGRPINPAAVFQWWYHVTAMTVIVYIWLVLNRAARTHSIEVLRTQLDADQLAASLAQAELAILEAQIEPHFLFNSLAHIKRQYRLDAQSGSLILTALIEYLDRAMPALQRSDWTVGDEIDLIEIYLGILAERFGSRLGYEIDVEARFKAVRLPGLTIATLVENAVRHGLTPKSGKGTVRVTVTLESNNLLIRVEDDGVGLQATSGSGLGLATVRARLRGRFGGRAMLAIAPGRDRGVEALIRIAGIA